MLGVLVANSGQQLNVTFTDALPRFFLEFIAGMTTMRLVPFWADMSPTASITVLGGIVTAVGAVVGIDLLAACGLWLALTGLAMRADAERPPLFGRRPVLRGLGLLSYSFYMSFGISELLLAQLFRHQGWDPHLNRLAYAAAMTLLTLLLAMLLYTLVEQPCRRLSDRWLLKPQA